MDFFIYSIIVIAISVVFSTAINAMIMRKAAEIATNEIAKIESRMLELIKKAIKK